MMDEKSSSYRPLPVQEQRPVARWLTTRTWIRVLCTNILIAGLTWLYLFHYGPVCQISPADLSSRPYICFQSSPQPSIRRVSLEAHIMSKCPDAQVCLNELVVPAMQEISNKVDFSLSYIGLIDNDDVECKHGAGECLGNILELCAAELFPDPKIYLGFTMCMTNDYAHIPEKSLVEECALEYGIDFEQLNECASKDDGSHGLDLLRNSMVRSANANVTISCTVRLNDEIRCIRDDGQWKDCSSGSKPKDLVRDIVNAAS